MRLLGGLLIWVSSLYCGPRQSLFRRREHDVPGLYVELAQFGFGKGVTPGLQSRVARQAALCPSFALARQELARSGVAWDGKTVQRIAYQCGRGLLALRKHQLLLWRAGQLAAGTELKGKRVTVQIDGGRTKIRGPLQVAPMQEEKLDAEGLVIENAPGRSRARPQQTFAADWREPKLVTIFVHDEQGRMVKGSQATVDGTFLGPDALAELTAMHLHRLGAAEALSVTFVSDGAPWIWDRVAKIAALAQLDQVQIYEVLDCCHAAHHISLALAAMGLGERERMPLYRELRTLLAQRPLAARGGRVVRSRLGSRRRETPNGTRLPAQARRSRPVELRAVSRVGTAAGKRRDRERHPAHDQSAAQEQRDVLARAPGGNHASSPCPSAHRSVG